MSGSKSCERRGSKQRPGRRGRTARLLVCLEYWYTGINYVQKYSWKLIVFKVFKWKSRKTHLCLHAFVDSSNTLPAVNLQSNCLLVLLLQALYNRTKTVHRLLVSVRSPLHCWHWRWLGLSKTFLPDRCGHVANCGGLMRLSFLPPRMKWRTAR